MAIGSLAQPFFNANLAVTRLELTYLNSDFPLRQVNRESAYANSI